MSRGPVPSAIQHFLEVDRHRKSAGPRYGDLELHDVGSDRAEGLTIVVSGTKRYETPVIFTRAEGGWSIDSPLLDYDRPPQR